MDDGMNVLILSCGTRNKIVQYFKKEIGSRGSVMAADCSKLAPALYEADKYFIVPPMTESGYLDVLLAICRENNVRAVLSLIDPELSLLAKHSQDFLAAGTTPIVSDYDVVELCFDKYKMYQFLVEKGFKTVRTYRNKEMFYEDLEKGTIDYPVFAKPVTGSASLNINVVSSRDETDLLFARFENLIIQEYMEGVEYGADVYIDLISEEPVAIFTKEKIKMRAGETDKSVSIKDQELFDLLKMFAQQAGLKGIIDVDIFKVNGEYYISEVNPRFGGGYPHAYECGVNIPKMILRNIDGKENIDLVGRYDEGVYMMKYSEVKIIS